MGGDKRQGGSTITQQVAKNLLVGDSLTFERKIREVIVANRIEKTLTKQEILEIYLNSIYLGRSSWGIDLAARAYFGKPVKDLTLAEGAFIAGLTKGPAYYNPDRYRERAHERLAYVLTRMKDDGVITAAQATDAEAERLNFAAFTRVRRDTGFHLVDEIGREARDAGRHRLADRAVLSGALDHPARRCSAPPRRRCRRGLRNTSRAPAASSSARPKPT